MDEKLSAINQKIQTIVEIPEMIKENCKSYKDALFSNTTTIEENNTTSLKGMIKDALFSNTTTIEENNTTSLKGMIKDAISERQSDVENLEERKTNIIVFNAPELEASSMKERKLDDNVFFVETPSATEIYHRHMFSKHADWGNELKATVYDLY